MKTRSHKTTADDLRSTLLSKKPRSVPDTRVKRRATSESDQPHTDDDDVDVKITLLDDVDVKITLLDN